MENQIDPEKQKVLSQLRGLGFEFNPFESVEASKDPHIHACLIGHEIFSVAWKLLPAVLFAPAGGGKTAMRIYTLRTCWPSNGQRLRFPISYDMPVFADPSTLDTIDAHETALATAAATDLFLACAYRPDMYLSLPDDRRRMLLSMLKHGLPVDMDLSLMILEESSDPRALSAHLDHTYLLPEPPASLVVKEYCRKVRADIEMGLPDCSTSSLFNSLVEFILKDLNFGSVFILMDGIDGTPGVSSDAAAQFKVIAPLCEKALLWMKTNIYLKAFLPLELKKLIEAQAADFYKEASHATITWNIPGLVEILRRRVYVASQGKFSSLDAISSPAIREMEITIAKQALPLPREAIILAGLVLSNCLAGVPDKSYLEPEDIARAIEQYRQRTIFPASSHLGKRGE